ncbi:MAG: Eco57I restriction-modification methylase domain-containing protein [Desulfobaccales bacterium]
MKRTLNTFQTVKTEGAIIPVDLLRRILDGDRDIPGLRPEDYHLAKSERLNEAATRAWNRLQGAWQGFKDTTEVLPGSDAGTSLTRERWLLIFFQELGYGRLTTRKAYEIEGKTYPISHNWQNTPIHLVSFRQDLDKRTPGRAGAARVSPHSLVQELINRSDDHLWGFVSNGLSLRLLRDNVSLTRQAYVEFDLQAMMDSEAYSDFFLLFLLCHQSRVEVPEDKTPEHCWLEKWYKTAAQQGVRALDQLRDGVQRAIEALGGGFLAYPGNGTLREKLRSGALSTQDYYRQVLRQVYRLLFLFVAEDRELLSDPSAPFGTGKLYLEHYSTSRLRSLAGKTRGTRHPDLWRALRLVLDKLHGGCQKLALPALGGYLFSAEATADLNGQDIANADLLKAFRVLTFAVARNVLRPINYRSLGPEELGSVYESLLEMHPAIYMDASNPEDRFNLSTAAGSERKTTGSYYTPSSLVNCLLDSALEPVLNAANRKPNPEKALLDLKICDPACGSGHFLIAAAHRITKRLATIRTGEDEPAPEQYQHALRDVIGHCIYGVDINPMSVELCKVSLWLEAMEPGKPLAFLDHHIKCGNSLLGATPTLLKKGIPDVAFKPIEGDDNDFCREYKQRNRNERQGNPTLFTPDGMPWEQLGDLGPAMLEIDGFDDSTLAGLQRKEEAYSRFVRSNGYLFGKLLYDAWCAAFVWKKYHSDELPYPITQEILHRIRRNPHGCPPWMRQEIIRLAQEYRFFHWHLEFPDVFKPKSSAELAELNDDEVAGWTGGFDCVLGNPPWERIKLQEKEFFASSDPEIANAPNAASRRRLIAKLRETNPILYLAFQEALRRADGESCLVRDTGKYPLCGRGDVNTYSIFAELKRSLLNPSGRVGCIVPSGIATEDSTKFFFQSLMDMGSLVSLYSFENEEFIFPAIHHATKFCLLTMAAPGSELKRAVDFMFFTRQVEHLAEKERHFTLTAEDITLLNPNTRTCPIFRYKQDAELTKHIYRRIPVLIREARNKQPEENPWGISFMRMIDMTNDSGLFRTREQLEAEGFVLQGNIFRRDEAAFLPLYEGKMFWHFDHRFGTYRGQTQAQANQGKLPELTPEQHRNPDFLSLPRYWVADAEVKARVPKRPEILASALEAPERWRPEAVRKAFCYWAAGYWRQQGDEDKAEKLLAMASLLSVADTQGDAFNKWLLGMQCERLQERFPLTEADVNRMASCLSDPVPLAEELVERFSPHWFVAFRDVTSAVVLRTAVFSLVSFVGVGNTAPLMFFDIPQHSKVSTLISCLNSFALDYCARQSIGGSHLNYLYLKQFPVPTPATLGLCPSWDSHRSIEKWCSARVGELVYTAWDHERFSRDGGNSCPPFMWDEERRFLIRAELDAAFFHLYLGNEPDWQETGSKELLAYFPTPRHAVEYIMDTFRILRERDEAAYGSFKTKTAILEVYDEMARVMAENAAAEAAGRQPTARYETRLNPPAGPPMDAMGNFIPMDQWDRAKWPPHIHPPKEEAVERPEEVPLEEFVAMAYPATDADKTICAAALAIVEQSQGLSSADHLDVLLLATHPEWCKILLKKTKNRGFKAARENAPRSLVVGENQSIQWKRCRDYLEKIQAITVNRRDRGQAINPGTNLSSVRERLPGGVDEIIQFALKAMGRIAVMRADLSSVPQEQRNVIEKLDQHRINQLIAAA